MSLILEILKGYQNLLKVMGTENVLKVFKPVYATTKLDEI